MAVCVAVSKKAMSRRTWRSMASKVPDGFDQAHVGGALPSTSVKFALGALGNERCRWDRGPGVVTFPIRSRRTGRPVVAVVGVGARVPAAVFGAPSRAHRIAIAAS